MYNNDSSPSWLGMEEPTFAVNRDRDRQEVLRKMQNFQAFNSRAPSVCSMSSINNNSGTQENDNWSLRQDLLRKTKSEEYQEICEARQDLPVVQQCRDILKSIREHKVIMIVGGSGCGKTTQIPQMVLDDFIFNNCGTECRIACVQPAKSKAISVAERAARDRLETIGNSIGLHVGGRIIMPRHTGYILYCTSAILIRNFNSDPLLRNITIVILDDLQTENGEELRQLLDLLKSILPHRSDLKVILLSTTIAVDVFCNYFKDYHALFVHDRLLPKISKASSMSTLPEIIQDDASIITVSDGESTTTESNYRRSSDFLNKYEGRNPLELSKREKQQIKRHRRNLKRLERISGRTEQMPATCIKHRLSSLDCNSELQVAIIDRSDPHGRLNDDLWLKLEERLLRDMISSSWSNQGISFDGANWSRGVKIVKCGNNRSVEFLKETIKDVCENLPHLLLEVIPQSTLPLRINAKMWIPPPVPPTNAILTLIANQNPRLNTNNWQIVNCIPCKNNFGQVYRLFIDGNSARIISETQGRIKFGLNFIRIRFDNK
ncbi:uncharacterized protein LOC142226621 [Haematobia irritans]|uniref:uncharacterized protein LOC142226621 n=1 Tax=Haematobia irritans TaxID=7368 RepID=UPI003F508A06